MLMRNKSGEERGVLLWTHRKRGLMARTYGSALSSPWSRTVFARHPSLWQVAKYSADEAEALIRADVTVQLAPDCEPARKCAMCGCHDFQACKGGCRWVAPDLCSACAAKMVPPPMSAEDFLR